MKPILFLACLVSAPALAHGHEPLSPALSGRSPHVAMRATAAATPCHAWRAGAPSGRQPIGFRAEPPCPAAQDAARDQADGVGFGR